MKDFKQFVKMAAWLTLTVFVVGGLWMASAMWDVPGDVVFIRVVLMCVCVFGLSLCGMMIIDAALEAKERGVRYNRYDSIPNRSARCKGYVDLTPGERR